MSSSYLNNTRSVEELDALLEESLRQAGNNGKNIIKDEVRDVIGNIGTVSKTAIVRIEEKANEIVATVAASVVETRSELLIETDEAQKQIASLVDDPSKERTVELLTSMIQETSYLSLGRISKCADAAIQHIRTESTNAINDLRKTVANSFRAFRSLTTKAVNQIREKVEEAATAFAEAKKNKVEDYFTLENIKKEAEKIVIEAEISSRQIEDEKSRTTLKVNEAIEEATRRIERAHAEAAEKINEARDAADNRLHELVKDAIYRLTGT